MPIRETSAIRWSTTALCCATVMLFMSASGAQDRGNAVPAFALDSTWPKLPLPNKWTFGGVTGLTVDHDDLIWVLHRPNDLDETENFAALNPPIAECCVKAPAVLAFDLRGKLVHSWDTQQGHVILVDAKNRVWVGSDTFRIFTKEGKPIAEFPRASQAPPHAGPTGRQPTTYPHDIELIAVGIEGASFDEAANEIYVVDNYLAGRVMVFDMETYRFKRGWGAYGKPLKDIAPMPRPDYNPAVLVTTYQDFMGHVTITVVGNEVLVADRRANRIQVFAKQGQFVREFLVAPQTGGDGSAVGVAPSKDLRLLYVADHMNNVVWIMNRHDGKTLGRFGYLGRNGGGFNALHMIAVDSTGNIYTGEVDPNNRVQKFAPVN